MHDWTPQIWISLFGAAVSVAGACLTLYWTRRRMIWDAGKELGALRAEALNLATCAQLLDHPTWSMGVREFQERRSAWNASVVEKQPLMGLKARTAMDELRRALASAQLESFGVVRVFSDNEEDDLHVTGNLSVETRAVLERTVKLLSDPHRLGR